MNRTTVFVWLALMVVAGCRPVELPEGPTTATPRFFAQAAIEGMPLLLEAGVDSIYMHTDAWVEGGSERRSGALAPLPCPEGECGPALGFVFRKEGAATPATGASWQWEGPWYASPESVPATPQAQPVLRLDASASITTGPVLLYRWLVDDSELYVRTGPTLELPVPPGTTRRKVSLETTDANGCQSTYTTFVPTQGALSDSSGLQISMHQQPTGLWQLEASWQPTAPAASAFMWGNGLIGPFNIVLEEGVQCVRVDDTLANVYAELCLQVLEAAGSDPPDFCLARFASMAATDTVWIQDLPFGDGAGLVEVWYVDESGHYYSSALGPQSDASVLWLSGIQPYLENERGMPTLEMSLTGQVYVYDDAGTRLTVAIDSAHIAVGRME